MQRKGYVRNISVNILTKIAITLGTSHVRHGRVPCPGDYQLRGHLLPDGHVGGGRHLLHPHVRLLALPRGHGRRHIQQHRQVRNSEHLWLLLSTKYRPKI